MTEEQYIKSKDDFQVTAGPFLKTIFSEALQKGLGDIEIRVFLKDGSTRQYFYSTTDDAVDRAHNLCNSGIDVYFGVNPRTGKGGKKENIHYLIGFHAEVDYGEYHRKKPVHQTYDEAMNVIGDFLLQPTLIVHSGGGS